MAEHFVAQTATGDESGSDLNNLQSQSSHNADTYSPGDTVWLIGTITGEIDPPSNGVLGNPITYRGDYPGSPGELSKSSGASFHLDGCNFVTLKNVSMTLTGTSNGVLFQNTTDGNRVENVTITSSTTGRAVYVLGSTHTRFYINAYITHGSGVAITSANDSQAVLIDGAGVDGVGGSFDLFVQSGAASVADGSSAFIGIDIEDWQGITGSFSVVGFHTGLRLVDSDGGVFYPVTVKDNKAATQGDGVVITTTSANNWFMGGLYSGNYDGYQDASTTGPNYICGSIHDSNEVNCISLVNTGTGESVAANNTLVHSPSGDAGHGIVVQNGDLSTLAKIVNNIVTCDVLGSNVQCIAIDSNDGGAIIDTVDIDRNLLYTTGSAHLGALDGTNYDTLSAWQAALATPTSGTITGQEANSIEEDPDLDANYRPRNKAARTLGANWWSEIAGGRLPSGYGGGPFPAWGDVTAGAHAPVTDVTHPRNS